MDGAIKECMDCGFVEIGLFRGGKSKGEGGSLQPVSITLCRFFSHFMSDMGRGGGDNYWPWSGKQINSLIIHIFSF